MKITMVFQSRATLVLALVVMGITHGTLTLASSAVDSSNPPVPLDRKPLHVCKYACAKTYEPVCGDDNVTYANRCFANCANCEVAWNGTCDPGSARKLLQHGTRNLQFGCKFACIDSWEPVCGIDRKTYSNRCYAKCHNVAVVFAGACKVDGPNIRKLLHQGEQRRRLRHACHYACARGDDRPVCGEDNVTYRSKCAAKCADAGIAREGACEVGLDRVEVHNRKLLQQAASYPDTAVSMAVDMCTTYYTPVCDSASNVHINKCYAEVANATVVEDRSCISPTGGPVPSLKPPGGAASPSGAPSPAPDCPCTRDYRPVCGADGVTYPNPCIAQCEGAVIVSEGACPGGGRGPSPVVDDTPSTPPPARGYFACTLEYSPVCGKDGRTYPNRCSAEKGAGYKGGNHRAKRILCVHAGVRARLRQGRPHVRQTLQRGEGHRPQGRQHGSMHVTFLV